jgi:CRISPR system Cascade subunit CasE
MSAFPASDPDEPARALHGVLYRVEEDHRRGSLILLVQSRTKPDWSRLEPGYLLDTGGDPENPACKRIQESYERLAAGSVLVFRLRANPTRKIDTRSGPDGRRRNGRRVELVTEDAQREWLQRKAGQAGFRLLSVRAKPEVPNVRSRNETKCIGHRRGENGAHLTFGSVLFEGLLEVTDGERFRGALEAGIGPGKAFGFGLLSVARAPK